MTSIAPIFSATSQTVTNKHTSDTPTFDTLVTSQELHRYDSYGVASGANDAPTTGASVPQRLQYLVDKYDASLMGPRPRTGRLCGTEVAPQLEAIVKDIIGVHPPLKPGDMIDEAPPFDIELLRPLDPSACPKRWVAPQEFENRVSLLKMWGGAVMLATQRANARARPVARQLLFTTRRLAKEVKHSDFMSSGGAPSISERIASWSERRKLENLRHEMKITLRDW